MLTHLFLILFHAGTSEITQYNKASQVYAEEMALQDNILLNTGMYHVLHDIKAE